MTFYEAAVEVLRGAGRPLHFKKITEIAIKRHLLSHVGKTPELTMGTRLSQEARKNDGTSVVVRTRPGVFALRAWTEEAPSTPDRVRETVAPRNDKPNSRSANSAADVAAKGSKDASALPGIMDHIAALEEAFEDDDDDESATATPATTGSGQAERRGRGGRRRRRRRRRGQGVTPTSDERAADNEPSTVGLADILEPAVADPLSEENMRAALVREEVPTAPAVRDEVDHEEVHKSLQRHVARIERRLMEKLDALEPKSGELLSLVGGVLDALGYAELTEVSGRRYVATWTQGLSRINVTVAIFGRRTVSREDIVEIRDSLARHEASQGVVVTLGEVDEEALTEATLPALAPIVVLDGRELARLAVAHGVGVERRKIEIPVLTS